MVQVWKLDRFCFPNSDPPLNSSSNPVFCGHMPSCGNVTMQVFTDKDDTESRTADLNLFNTPGKESTTTRQGPRFWRSDGRCRISQSRFVQRCGPGIPGQPLDSRGRQYVEAMKKACRRGVPSGGTGRLTPACVSVELPPEPVAPTQQETETQDAVAACPF